MRRILAVFSSFTALLALAAVAALYGTPTRAQQQPSALGAPTPAPASRPLVTNVVLFTKREPDMPAKDAAALADARRVDSMTALQAELRSNDLLVIDRSAFDEVDSAFLRQEFRSGRPVIGINISQEELSQRGGFLDAAGEINPLFKAYTRFPGPLPKPGYSHLYVSMSGSHIGFGGGQAWFSDNLFRGNLHRYGLLADGLTEIYNASTGGNRVVPLSCLSDPHCSR